MTPMPYGPRWFRQTISAQVKAARAAWPDGTPCHLCGQPTSPVTVTADHVPTRFATIVRAYLDACARHGRPVTRDGWRTFHAAHATYRPACQPCNAAHAPRARAWHQRHGRAA